MKKVSLGIFHYNAQYVAGRRDSYWKQTRASLIPQLKFHKHHPNWKCDLEISGHHLLFLERHFPAVLETLRQLNNKGTIELVTVHYSDQIYLAYPKRDLLESIKICDEIYAKLGLIKSPVWFGQENFFGEGIIRVMKETEYKIALVNRNQYSYFHSDVPQAPYYRFKGYDADILLSGTNGQKNLVEQTWNFWGDGELAFARANIYFPNYGPSSKKYATRVARSRQQEIDGVEFLTISEYIAWCKQEHLQPAELHPLLDGSWNHFQYGGAYLWMGTSRFPFERDGDVRSLTFQSRAKILAAEIMVAAAQQEGINVDVETRNLRVAWKHQLLAEVSDSTGQTPVKIEVVYSIVEAQRALEIAEKIICAVLKKLHQTSYAVETKSGKLLQESEYYDLSSGRRTHISYDTFRKSLNLHFWLQNIKLNSTRISFYKVGSNRYDIDLSFYSKYTHFYQRVLSLLRTRKKKGLARALEDHICNYSGMWWNWNSSTIAYCPATMEEQPVEYALTEFENGRQWIPAPNGYLQVRPDLHVVKHNLVGNTHICFTCDAQNHRMGLILLNPPRTPFLWRLSFIQGSREQAITLANQLNVWPIVKLGTTFRLTK